jgi:membrane protease YdiL (CAAX protease family)
VFFVVSLWFGQDLGVRGQVVVNVVVIFFGGCLLLIRRYGLNPVEAFALHVPHPAAWLAVVIGAPSALVLAVGFGQLIDAFVFPVPERMLESFSRAIAPPSLPLWQLVLFLTVLPGIFEELTFRGMLLHGLRERIRRRWLLAVTVGIIFGFFHVSLFRILPTALLGFVLTWVVLFSGSIYPAMLWHALNNAIGLVPGRLELWPEDFEPGGWLVVPAAVGLAVSMWILWRSGLTKNARGATPD